MPSAEFKLFKAIFEIISVAEVEKYDSLEQGICECLKKSLNERYEKERRLKVLMESGVLEKVAELPKRGGTGRDKNKLVATTEEEKKILEQAKEAVTLSDELNAELKKIDKLKKALAEFSESQSAENPTHVIKDGLMPIEQSTLSRLSSQLSIMYSSKAVNALALARGKGKFDPFSRQLKFPNEVNIFAPENAQKIGVGAAKAFRYILAEFTKRNHQNTPQDKVISRIFLDVADFAAANGVDVNSEDDMRNFRHKLKGNLNILLTHKISWNEKVKGKKMTFPAMTWISAYEFNAGNTLMVEVTQSMAEILTLLPMIYFPRSLYLLPDREFNAFAIGEALCLHYCQDNNVIKGTHNKISVRKLLEYTSFPTYEELKEHKMSWEQKVKWPLLDALDKLKQCGFLKDCEFCYEGGIEIPDEVFRAGKIDSYEKFISLLVKFELNDFAPHAERVAEIKQRKNNRIAASKTARKRKKKADSNTTNE